MDEEVDSEAPPVAFYPKTQSRSVVAEQTSSIRCLSEDILWNIFLMNANMDEDAVFVSPSSPEYAARRSMRALTVTRRSSQVCRLWRDVILGTSSIWGQLIDWDIFLELKTDDWRREVLRRSGSHPLYIRSEWLIGDGPKFKNFVSLVDEEWDRIRGLKFGISPIITPTVLWTIYQILSRPAHSLQLLHIFFESSGGQYLFQEDPVLFSNHAPALQELSLQCTNLKFDPHALMTSRIRSLIISYATYLELSDIVECLANTPHLERLAVRHCHLIKHENFPVRETRIELPSLCYIEILDPQFGPCASIIDCIMFPEHCVVNLSCAYTREFGMASDPVEEDASNIAFSRNLDRLCSTFRRVTQRFTNWYSIEALVIALDSRTFTFNDITGLSLRDTGTPYRSWNNLLIKVVGDMAENKLLALFRSVSTVYLGDLKRLVLDFEWGAIDFSQFNLVDLFKRMTVVEHIDIGYWHPEGIRFLCSITGDTKPAIFPRLKSLAFQLVGRVKSNDLEILLTFFRRRRSMGIPMEVLQMRFLHRVNIDFQDLKELDGLTVVWQLDSDESEDWKTYICGSGKPEILPVNVNRVAI
ncbi:hypothetical protein CVT26_003222 [Gymnopilus dilepis]|uniref:F-box domain-containing protein n=1 Tax=Gymnopilus dilepis TaxID=231916 RepID=A0A409Y562_9AGAR|nr:hypothetical protein CVT26_003222 [Gymnopilus dilepis]